MPLAIHSMLGAPWSAPILSESPPSNLRGPHWNQHPLTIVTVAGKSLSSADHLGANEVVPTIWDPDLEFFKRGSKRSFTK